MCNCIKEHCTEMSKLLNEGPGEVKKRVSYPYQIPGKNKFFLAFNVVDNGRGRVIDIVKFSMGYCPFCGERLTPEVKNETPSK